MGTCAGVFCLMLRVSTILPVLLTVYTYPTKSGAQPLLFQLNLVNRNFLVKGNNYNMEEVASKLHRFLAGLEKRFGKASYKIFSYTRSNVIQLSPEIHHKMDDESMRRTVPPKLPGKFTTGQKQREAHLS